MIPKTKQMKIAELQAQLQQIQAQIKLPKINASSEQIKPSVTADSNSSNNSSNNNKSSNTNIIDELA